LIPDCWCNYRESTFAYIELSFRKTFLETKYKDPMDIMEI